MPLSHAILGFLEFRPMTGYDLKKYFDQSIAHFWSATKSHVYQALEKLEKDGFVVSQIIPQQGKPNRREYQITETGRAELYRWLTSPLPPGQLREGWLIQVFFSHQSTNEEIVALLEARRKAIRERLEVHRTVVQDVITRNAEKVGIERARQLWQITLDHGIDYYEFEIAWLEKITERINKLPY
jgi:DNA-binding PadR family transcriptional regulator